MTVAAQVKQTLASLKGTQAALQQMASVEDKQQVKEILENSTRRLENIINNFENRIKVMEFEEAQYKGF